MRTISLGISGIAAALSLATLSIPATAAIPPRPGVVNYVEGNASIDGRRITLKDIGSVALDKNQTLQTNDGKAEVLLTPGVFLRLSGNAQLRMVSADLTNTSVALDHGEALVEATDLLKVNHLTILDHGATTTLDKNGLYNFNADSGVVSVYEGEATVREDDHTIKVKKGRDVNLSGPLKTAKFDRNQLDNLYQWSSARSQYVSEASLNSAQMYAGNPYWYGAGWYWNPYFDFYGFIPGYGYMYSPFGWGFYSPFYAPYVFYGGGFGGRRVGAAPPRGVFRGGAPVTPLHSGGSNAFHGSAVGGGFHGGGFGGGGFHGGGGGFHGGGGRR